MRPAFRPELANGAWGDPVLYVDFLHERRALLFDLGDLTALPARKLLAVSHVFVSHAHLDHFAGFDRLLRLLTGRARTLQLFGPEGFAERVGHRLAGYTWNLASELAHELTLVVAEVPERGAGARARFRLSTGFAREPLPSATYPDGRLVAEPGFTVHTAVLDHRTPCLAFALAETEHIDIWRNRLEQRGLATGDWLRGLKRALHEGRPGDHPVPVAWREPGPDRPATLPLGELAAAVVSRRRGQKIAYVVDVLGNEANARRIARLARGADRLYMEAAFAGADAERAAATHHLTAPQAGAIARRAGVGELVPCHFSPRYGDDPERLRHEALAAFGG